MDENTIVMTPLLKGEGLLRTYTDSMSSHTVEVFQFSQRGRYSLLCSSELHTMQITLVFLPAEANYCGTSKHYSVVSVR